MTLDLFLKIMIFDVNVFGLGGWKVSGGCETGGSIVDGEDCGG